jgi:imidazolonepropionase
MEGAAASGPRAAGILASAALAAYEGIIVWVGPSDEADASVELVPGAEVIDAGGAMVTPGLIDPHTHLVFAGDRSGEFSLRCGGASYLAIAEAGGGIAATVAATRAQSEEQLFASGSARLGRLLDQGVTTVEIKTGYGLSVAEELRLLRVITALGQPGPIEVAPTLLGLHALPAERRDQREAFVSEIIEELVPAAADAGAWMADAFLEQGAFTEPEVRRYFAAAQKAGLGLRLHADQLSSGRGAELASEFYALAADHLEQISPAGIEALAESGTAAVLAPVSSWVLRLPGYAPARQLLESGVTVALASNWNPGSAPTENLALTLGHACLSLGLQPGEALRASTHGAARALGLDRRIGRLAVGWQADLVIFGCADHRHLCSHLGVNHARVVVKRGKVVVRRGLELCAD